jgi:hypothetical protein
VPKLPYGEKYRNHAQLCQGVCQVEDATITQGEQCFLNVLAAHWVKTLPHPGNEKLMRTCKVKTRQGVNFIAGNLIKKGLIEIIERGNGRGKATVYRIRTEDPRFPFPKPASSDLPL